MIFSTKPALKKWNFTIRKKIIVIFSLLISIISVFILVYFPTQQEKKSISALDDKAQSIAKLLAFNISPALYFDDRENINEIFNSTRQHKDVVYLVVTDNFGKIVTATDQKLADQVDFLHCEKNHIFRDGMVFKTKTSILNNGVQIGTLFMGLSLQELRVEISRSQTTIALVSFLILVLGFLTVISLSIVLTTPLKQMVRTFELVSQGDLTQRAMITSKDEVGHLADSFNKMVQNMESAYSELENINQNLEQRVVERTKELQQEINERIRIEEEIRHSEERFRILVENSNDALYVVQNHQFVFINFKFQQLLGYSLAEISSEDFILTDLIAEKSFTDGQDKENFFAGETNQAASFNFTGCAKNKSEIDFEVRVTPIMWEEKAAVLGSMRDVTERNRLHGQLQQAAKMEAVGRLAGGIAHDFNNFLTAINGYVELLKEELTPDSSIYSDIEEIGKASNHAASLTRQLLAFSRQQVLNLEVVQLNDIIKNIEKMLRRMIGEDIQLSTHLADNLGNTKADAGQIEQILINLAVNSRDAMPNGGILAIETANAIVDEKQSQLHPDQKPGYYVQLSVSDNGTGMSEEVKEKIFEPFFSTKEKGKGTGLGLATVYGIIKQSDGTIRVYSELGRGTTFIIYLPCVDQAAEQNESQQVNSDLLCGNETILIVEDEKIVRELTVRILKHLGYQVIEAQSGKQALEIVQNNPETTIDLLLTDVVMPNMSGIDLASTLREKNQNLKTLFMSGHTSNAIINNGILNAGEQFIQKPFNPATLASKVRQVITASQQSTILEQSIS